MMRYLSTLVRTRTLSVAVVLITSVTFAHPANAQTPTVVPPSQAAAWDAIAAAENTRASTPAQLQVLFDGSRSTNATIRSVSVRALGRLQRTDLSDTIARLLHDPSPDVRAHAASAIALANIANRSFAAVRDTIIRALGTESHPVVVGALAETLGRFRNTTAQATRETAAILLRYLDRGPAARAGVTRGLHFMSRQPIAVRAGLDTARGALTAIATGTDTQHARRLATESIALAGLGSEDVALRILRDADPVVRRGAMLLTAATSTDTAAARRIAMRGLGDVSWLVRYEALRQLAGNRLAPGTPCSMLMPHARDLAINTHVRLQAIDMLGNRCAGADAATTAFLDSTARTLPGIANERWHAAAHALVALASRDAVKARAITSRFAAHPNFFVRTYAANTALITRDTATLIHLAADAKPNVRTAAVLGLTRVVRHAADSIYLAQLALDDGQLLMTAAAALDSTTRTDAGSRVIDALDRVTALRSENSRDGRVALINILPRVGTSALVPRLTPYLSDFDPTVAERAAVVLKGWGSSGVAAPNLLPPEPVPGFAELAWLAKMRMTIEMSNGVVFEVRLLPFDAPANAARFARLAREGWFNGLTLHRVEPNFVVQGGSPNANEYAGASRFSRDEIGYPNNRGTIGLSTRGHDTGDAQIFINVIDNTQLDPLYTVFAEVTSGMAQVDRILEGAAIKKITLR